MNPLYANCWDVYEWCMKTVPCRVALDIGANGGGYTQTLLNNGFEVHAFEPVPDMYAKCVERFRDVPNVHLNNCGLAEAPGVLHGVTVLTAWSLGRPGQYGLSVCPDYEHKKPFPVRLDTVDRYLAGRPVGLIKLDVDGYEPKVLEGAERTIAECRPPILCEISEYIEKMGTPAEAFCNQVFRMGYRIVSMDGKYKAINWFMVKDCWPYHSSFDVMLLPAEMEPFTWKPNTPS